MDMVTVRLETIQTTRKISLCLKYTKTKAVQFSNSAVQFSKIQQDPSPVLMKDFNL